MKVGNDDQLIAHQMIWQQIPKPATDKKKQNKTKQNKKNNKEPSEQYNFLLGKFDMYISDQILKVALNRIIERRGGGSGGIVRIIIGGRKGYCNHSRKNFRKL